MGYSKILLFKHNYTSSFYLSGVMFLILSLETIYFKFGGFGTYGFAEEIGNVAASLATGGGFADLLNSKSGPTAWCPPLYILYYAGIFKLFGVKSFAAYWFLFLSRALLLSITFYLLLNIDFSKIFNRYKILLFPIFFCYATVVIITRKADDVFLQVFVASLMVYVLTKLDGRQCVKSRILLLVTAAIIPFTSLAYFLGLAVVLVWFLVRTGNWSNSLSPTLISALFIMILGASFWGYHNSNRLGRFIPFKSNLWFEFYLANVIDDDGVSKWSNFRSYHPLGNPQVGHRYKAMGEVAFLDQYREYSIQYLADNKMDFLRKIGNRLFEAYIFTTSQRDTEFADIDNFHPHDLKVLRQIGLIQNDYWVNLETAENEFLYKIGALDLVNESLIVDDWRFKHKIVSNRLMHGDSIKNFIRSVAICIIPILAIIVSLLVKTIRENSVFLLSLVLYFLSIGPYIAVSFLPRYQFMQMTFFVLFTFLVSAYLAGQIMTRFQSKAE